MTSSTSRSRPKPLWAHLLWALLAMASVSLRPTAAASQGRCSCNRGCHQFPGQCVQSGSSGCEAGFAPFCGTRANSCPNAGWVTCSGECTCVRITPLDAGVVDSGIGDVPRPDVPMSVDVPMFVDVPMSVDRPMPVDRPMSVDVPMSVDRPLPLDAIGPMDAPAAADVSTPRDVGAPTDAPVGADVAAALDAPRTDAASADVPARDVGPSPTDAPVSLPDAIDPMDVAQLPDGALVPDAGSPLDAATPDAPAADDAGCVCAGGACVGGICYRDRCTYNPELGFTCAIPGTTCRLIGEEPLCIPVCAGVTCADGEFCDEREDGRCVVDRCASIQCPAGTVCRRNQCGRWGGADGGIFEAEDAVVVDSDASTSGPPTAMDDGCGCRAGGASGRPPAGAMLALMAGWVVVRRRYRASARK
jgi:MYXO-CTERM domain-containing protein